MLDDRALAVVANLTDFDRAQGAADVEEYGRPLFVPRRFIVTTIFRSLIGLASLTIRLLHPLHPYRIFIEGEIVKHRALLGIAVVPTRAGRGPSVRTILWALVIVLLLGELIGSLPGIGIVDALAGGKPLHPLTRAGLTDVNNYDLLRWLIR